VALVVNVDIVVVVEGVVVFKALVDTFPGAGGGAVFKAFSREVGIFPTGGGVEAVLDSLWKGVGFLPENGAGAVLTELGLVVVEVFLDSAVFAVEVGDDTFLVCFGGGWGGSGLFFSDLGIEVELAFFAGPAADVLAAAVVIAVVAIVAAMVGFTVVGI